MHSSNLLNIKRHPRICTHICMQAMHFPCKPILKHQANADWACNWVRPGYSESQSDPRLLFAFANCVHAKRNLTHTRIMCYNAQPCSISLAWLNHACTNTCNAKPCFRNEHLTTRHIAIRRASASVWARMRRHFYCIASTMQVESMCPARVLRTPLNVCRAMLAVTQVNGTRLAALLWNQWLGWKSYSTNAAHQLTGFICCSANRKVRFSSACVLGRTPWKEIVLIFSSRGVAIASNRTMATQVRSLGPRCLSFICPHTSFSSTNK